jgi:hypothetical protein
MRRQNTAEVVERPNGFTRFMASSGGRIARLALGAILIGAGVLAGPPAGYAIVAFGILPIASGALNLCPVAPVWGGRFLGSNYCARATSGRDEGETK